MLGMLRGKKPNIEWNQAFDFLYVWECGCGCFLKCFLFLKCIKINFFYFLKIIFNISTSK